jgi:hypothetical protein
MLTQSTELEAINLMLSAIGESPINTLEDNGVVDAIMARQILDSTSREVQSRAWHFNSENGVTLTPIYPSNYIPLPPNCIRVDTTKGDQQRDVIQRGLWLYDKDNHTKQFTKALIVDMVILLPFDELPESARQYITIRSARVFQERIVGSSELSQFTQGDELRSLVVLKEAEAETSDLNILTGSQSVSKIWRR